MRHLHHHLVMAYLGVGDGLVQTPHRCAEEILAFEPGQRLGLRELGEPAAKDRLQFVPVRELGGFGGKPWIVPQRREVQARQISPRGSTLNAPIITIHPPSRVRNVPLSGIAIQLMTCPAFISAVASCCCM